MLRDFNLRYTKLFQLSQNIFLCNLFNYEVIFITARGIGLPLLAWLLLPNPKISLIIKATSLLILFFSFEMIRRGVNVVLKDQKRDG